MGVARPFSTSSGVRGSSKLDREIRVACRAINFALSRSSLHSQISVASGALNFDPRDVWFEREVGVAGTALEVRRPLVHARHQHFGAVGAGDFLFSPLAPRRIVVDPDPCVAEVALDFAQTGWKHATAFWTRQGRRCHLGFHAQLLGHGITSFWSREPAARE